MELSSFSDHELLGRLDKLVRTERKITHLILVHINEVEARRLYAECGFDSMFKYLTAHCGYGEDSAYRRLQAARLLKKAPEIAEKIENGSLNLTQLTHVQKCLRQEIKAGHSVDLVQTLQILEQIENKSSFETKKVLAIEFNQPIQVHEVIKPQQNDTIRIELTFTTAQLRKLKQVQDLLSHVLPEGNFAEVIEHLAEKHIQKIMGKDLIEKSLKKNEVNEMSNELESLPPHNQSAAMADTTPSFTTARKRTAIKISDRRELLKKANSCCEYIDSKSGVQCKSTYQLQIDHQIPFALGGSSAIANLRVLCRTHNLLAAKQWGLAR